MKANITYLASALAALFALPGWAFNSGSTGADLAFTPTVNTQLPLPPSGVFNFTTVNIPAGVTVTFTKNATNTPVVILATGDVTIAGTISIAGTAGKDTGTAGDGNLGDDGVPGVGGPGGYDGGRGGVVGGNTRGGNGLGPGGGGGGVGISSNAYGYGGAGAGFGANGAQGYDGGNGGVAYGSATLLPLVGGSGGGGGRAGSLFNGAGGGGGGGALLIASSGTVTVTGSILADGGWGGGAGGTTCGGPGGGGSGGAVRILATKIAGNGAINAQGGSYNTTCYAGAGSGAVGRIRLEAETMTRTASTTPPYSVSSTPGPVFVTGLPTLRITSVGGNAVPDVPIGDVDVVLPTDAPNPVTIQLATTGVPVGNTVSVKLIPAQADSIVAVSTALSGTTDSATASAQVSIPSGPSVLQASVTYTVVVALGDSLSRYAQGERVEKVRLETALGESSTATLITVSGKEFVVPAALLAAAGEGS